MTQDMNASGSGKPGMSEGTHMSAEEHRQATKAVATKIGESVVCPSCQQVADLGVLGHYAQIGISGDQDAEYEDYVNTVMVVCTNCGFLRLYMLEQLGLLD